jgi:flagellum-specific ATP synthase
LYRKNEDLVSIGAYAKGSNPALDHAIALHEPLRNFLRQSTQDHMPRPQTFANLKKIIG